MGGYQTSSKLSSLHTYCENVALETKESEVVCIRSDSTSVLHALRYHKIKSKIALNCYMVNTRERGSRTTMTGAEPIVGICDGLVSDRLKELVYTYLS